MSVREKFEIKTGVKTDTFEVVARLKEMGLTIGQISDAVRRGYMATASLTTNHPPLMRGIIGWGEIVCALREHTAPNGWTRSDKHSWSVVNDPVGHIAILVATGNEETGIANASPSTKSLKGPHTVSAVHFNSNQATLDFGDTAPIPPSAESSDGRLTYILLVHRAPNEVHYELSLPFHISPEGRILGWQERLIFDAIPLDGEPIELVPPPQPDLDIDVRRKTA